MSAQPTPGPWSINEQNPDVCEVVGPDDEPLALAYSERPEAEANARLIAAAPALRDALAELVQWCEDNFAGQDSGPDLRNAEAALNDAGVKV